MRRTGIKEKKRKSRRITFPPTLKYLELLISLRINCNQKLSNVFLFLSLSLSSTIYHECYFEIIWIIIVVTIDFRLHLSKIIFLETIKETPSFLLGEYSFVKDLAGKRENLKKKCANVWEKSVRSKRNRCWRKFEKLARLIEVS